MSQLGKALTAARRSARESAGRLQLQSRPPSRPIRTWCFAGLRREDLFTVVLEQFQTDTADYADILLPVTTFLEHTDLYFAYGHYYLQLARPGAARARRSEVNVEIFRALALRMGFDRRLLPRFRRRHDPHAARFGASVPRWHHAGTAGSRAFRAAECLGGRRAVPALCRGRLRHALRQVRIRRRDASTTPPVESRLGDAELRGRYPLEMISPKNDDSMNSLSAIATVWTARPPCASSSRRRGLRGIHTGDRVRVFNDRGSLLLIAEVDGVVPPGVVRAPVGSLEQAFSDGAATSTRSPPIGSPISAAARRSTIA